MASTKGNKTGHSPPSNRSGAAQATSSRTTFPVTPTPKAQGPFPVTMGRSGIQMIENLQVYDMVWGTAHINRFCGKTDRPINVAVHGLHCFLIAQAWQPENYKLQLYALVHDLPEAYYGDFPGFLKGHFGPDFKGVLDDIDEKIFSQLGLPRADRIVLGDDLHRIDSSALTLEAMYGFDKFEPYHWPPLDLYHGTDIVDELITNYDAIGIYNFFNNTLDQMGQHNELLLKTLRRHSNYSHPVRDNRFG